MEIYVLIVLTVIVIAGIIVIYLKISSISPSGNANLEKSLIELRENILEIQKTLREELSRSRLENAESEKSTRQELSHSVKGFGDSVDKRMSMFSQQQGQNFDVFSKSLNDLIVKTEEKITLLKDQIEKRLESLQKDNAEQLGQMRDVVDEKLTKTLDQRITEKFKLVNDRLEQVYKGLGEMQALASGVGDLKKILSGVKVRGTWGEVQLSRILEQILTPEQYDTNVATNPKSRDRVEFAIKIPEKGNSHKYMYLPIDVKFPMEDYDRLIKAIDNADKLAVATAQKALIQRIKDEGADISKKYINPPNTTDFAVLYLPTEGLYAEVTQQIGLCEVLQRDYKVVVMGPNTVAAFLNSLQVGFRTLAIEKRTSEVWDLLTTIKKSFGDFGTLLGKAEKQLETVQNTIRSANEKTTTISHKLSKIEELPGQSKKRTALLQPLPIEETVSKNSSPKSSSES